MNTPQASTLPSRVEFPPPSTGGLLDRKSGERGGSGDFSGVLDSLGSGVRDRRESPGRGEVSRRDEEIVDPGNNENVLQQGADASDQEGNAMGEEDRVGTGDEAFVDSEGLRDGIGHQENVRSAELVKDRPIRGTQQEGEPQVVRTHGNGQLSQARVLAGTGPSDLEKKYASASREETPVAGEGKGIKGNPPLSDDVRAGNHFGLRKPGVAILEKGDKPADGSMEAKSTMKTRVENLVDKRGKTAAVTLATGNASEEAKGKTPPSLEKLEALKAEGKTPPSLEKLEALKAEGKPLFGKGPSGANEASDKPAETRKSVSGNPASALKATSGPDVQARTGASIPEAAQSHRGPAKSAPVQASGKPGLAAYVKDRSMQAVEMPGGVLSHKTGEMSQEGGTVNAQDWANRMKGLLTESPGKNAAPVQGERPAVQTSTNTGSSEHPAGRADAGGSGGGMSSHSEHQDKQREGSFQRDYSSRIVQAEGTDTRPPVSGQQAAATFAERVSMMGNGQVINQILQHMERLRESGSNRVKVLLGEGKGSRLSADIRLRGQTVHTVFEGDAAALDDLRKEWVHIRERALSLGIDLQDPEYLSYSRTEQDVVPFPVSALQRGENQSVIQHNNQSVRPVIQTAAAGGSGPVHHYA